MRDNYSALKKGPIVISQSIDAIKISLGLLIYKKSGKIVGGAYRNHDLDVPTGDDTATKLRDIIDSFNGNNIGKNNAYEIKRATVVYPNFPNGHSPMLQLMYQPHTKNYSSYFNSRTTYVMLE